MGTVQRGVDDAAVPRAVTPRVVVMGVSGSGKSTVAAALAAMLGVPYGEGDDFHPSRNRDLMTRGVPLTDADRAPWLRTLRDWLAGHPDGCVMSCSALRREYRDTLRAAGGVVLLHLEVPEPLLRARMSARPGHYMPVSLLASQLATLEPLAPDEPGICLDASRPLADVLHDARAALTTLTALTDPPPSTKTGRP